MKYMMFARLFMEFYHQLVSRDKVGTLRGHSTRSSCSNIHE